MTQEVLATIDNIELVQGQKEHYSHLVKGTGLSCVRVNNTAIFRAWLELTNSDVLNCET